MSDYKFLGDDSEALYQQLRKEVSAVLAARPDLNSGGLNDSRFIGKPRDGMTFEEHHVADREDMLTTRRLDEYYRAKCVLERMPQRKTFGRNGVGYSLKHLVEVAWLKRTGVSSDYYVSRGVFMAAALQLGVPMRQWTKWGDLSDEADFAVSDRVWTLANKRPEVLLPDEVIPEHILKWMAEAEAAKDRRFKR